MAKLKATPKNFTQAREALAGRDSVRLGNNTYLESIVDEGTRFLGADVQASIGVRLHDTYIVRFYADGRTTLHTDGWRTVTTKERINQFITGRVYQKNHEWFYVGHNAEGALDWDNADDFCEGYEVVKELEAQLATNTD